MEKKDAIVSRGEISGIKDTMQISFEMSVISTFIIIIIIIVGDEQTGVMNNV